MTADGPAALVIAIIAAAAALGGLVVGIIGLVQASRAHAVAKAASEAADGANELSAEANGIAREANQISKSSAEQAHERHDVRWDADFVDDGVLAVRNIGRDTAYDVLIRVTFEQGPVLEEESALIVRHHEIRVEMPAVKTQLHQDRREDATPLPPGILIGPTMRMYRLDIEASWVSGSGRAYSDADLGGSWSSLEPSRAEGS